MTVAAARSDVRIAIARDPSLVRTVRLVAAAVARRADCSDATVEEVRLAVGEACAVLIGTEEPVEDPPGQVEIALASYDAHFRVTVTGREAGPDSGFTDLGLDSWSLLRGIVEDLAVDRDDAGSVVHMSWTR